MRLRRTRSVSTWVSRLTKLHFAPYNYYILIRRNMDLPLTDRVVIYSIVGYVDNSLRFVIGEATKRSALCHHDFLKQSISAVSMPNP